LRVARSGKFNLALFGELTFWLDLELPARPLFASSILMTDLSSSLNVARSLPVLDEL
jgi:hypothetical protein